MNSLKPTPIFFLLIIISFLSGCSPSVVEEVSQGVTEGIIQEIEDYETNNRQKR